ncbi:MAG TPA: hypothetical protein VKD72_32845 [Gemmataceae bacterium]|nr:hypothetical protein [Gemmataceae bacterium]
MSANPPARSPARVIAGRRNQLKRRGLTAEGRARLRQSALVHRPWLRATGPRTTAGKARVAANARLRQKGEQSRRQLRAMLAELGQLAGDMASLRRSLQQGEMVLP